MKYWRKKSELRYCMDKKQAPELAVNMWKLPLSTASPTPKPNSAEISSSCGARCAVHRGLAQPGQAEREQWHIKTQLTEWCFFSFASFLPAKTHRKDFWKGLLRLRLLSWCFYFMGSSWFITGSHAVLYNSKCKSIWENADPNSGEGSFSTISMEKVKESGEKQIVGSHPERLGKHSLKKLPKSSLMSASLGHTG